MRRISLETAKLAVEKGFGYTITSNIPVIPAPNQVFETKNGKACIYECPYQAELQQWLREKHGVSVLVYLDETLSYIWTITGLHPRASIQEFHQSNEVWCGHYEDCLEAGLQAALKLM